MYIKIKRSDRKPNSFKLIRQLKCFLYLQYQRQVRIDTILKSEEVGKKEHHQIPKSLRTFYRYIGEIVYCANENIRDEACKWIVYYSRNSFIRINEDSSDIAQALPYHIWIEVQKRASCVQPVEPSKTHYDRLSRTILLTEGIMSSVLSECEYNESPLERFLTCWPMEKEKLKEYYDQNLGFDSRTFQRDIGVIYDVITFYLCDMTQEDSPLPKKGKKKRIPY